MKYRRNVGIYGETFATHILEEKGFEILERNYRGRHGEIDIIAEKEGKLHFVEVKTRYGGQCGYPAESVTDVKVSRMKATAGEYLRQQHIGWRDVSFDVFEIQADILWDIA